MTENLRVAIVGAASLRGKELNDTLGESVFASADFTLMDDEEALGQIESVGGDVTFIQRIEPASFEHVDFVFFAGDQQITRKHWHSAVRAGAGILDLTYALENEPHVLVRAPWVRDELREETDGSAVGPALDLQTSAIVPAHPAAVSLALLLLRLKKAGSVRRAWATILEPASEQGRAAMDELHQQTVNLLSFQPLPKEIYDAQVAFNLLPVFGEATKANLLATQQRVERHYGLIAGDRLPSVAIQLIHAPVFHGYCISLGVELEHPATTESLAAALTGEHVDVVAGDADAPSNVSTAGQEDIMLRLQETDDPQRFWIWAAVDNLKLSALNALACAAELRRLRPLGQVQ